MQVNIRIFCILALTGAATACALAESEEAVPFDSLPAAVQKAIQAQAEQGNSENVSIDTGRGGKVYKARIGKNGKSSLVTLGEDGRMISRETAFDDTPAPVQKTVKQLAARGALIGIERILDEDEIPYDVKINVNGGSRIFSVEEDGSLAREEVSMNETPAAVQRAISAQVAGGTVTSIGKLFDEDAATYEVEMNSDGKFRSFSIGPDGALLSVQIDYADLPPAVQKAADAIRGENVVKSVEKEIDDNEITYEVREIRNGETRGLVFRRDGLLKSHEIDLADAPPAVQATIRQRLGGGTIERIDRVLDGDAPGYEVETGGSEKAEFFVAENGRRTKERVGPVQLSPAAQRTIKDRIGDGFVLRIDEVFSFQRRGSAHYEIQGRRSGKDFDFSVGPEGRFLGINN